LKNLLVIIPARAGSKGLPNKNILKLNDKPLINYTIEAAKEVFDINQIVVSTDCIKIKSEAEKLGLNIYKLRPKSLAEDDVSSYDVIEHELNEYSNKVNEPDVVILLQPTSPLRTSKNIREALKLYNSSIDMVVSVKKSHSNPYFNLFEENDKGFLNKSKISNITRRQDCPDVWEFNGAIYIINVKSLRKTKSMNFERIVKYEMNEHNSIDIDNKLDFIMCKILIDENNKNYT